MKSLKQYITESVKTYKCTIKIAGEVDKKFLDMFQFNLKKFDPIKIGDPSTKPIQKTPAGFTGIQNQPVTIIQAEFRYPATEPMIQQMAQLCGCNVNMVRVLTQDYDDSINNEADGYSNQMRESPVLTHEEMDEQPGAKEANKAYGESYLSSIKKQMEGNKIDIPYEGTKTPDSFDPFKPYLSDDKSGAKSPMSTITRPAKPSTGASASK